MKVDSQQVKTCCVTFYICYSNTNTENQSMTHLCFLLTFHDFYGEEWNAGHWLYPVQLILQLTADFTLKDYVYA